MDTHLHTCVFLSLSLSLSLSVRCSKAQLSPLLPQPSSSLLLFSPPLVSSSSHLLSSPPLLFLYKKLASAEIHEKYLLETELTPIPYDTYSLCLSLLSYSSLLSPCLRSLLLLSPLSFSRLHQNDIQKTCIC